jgi:hypothetical protein
MALTTFTSGQVLTAAQLNAVQANDYNQTVSTKTASYTLVAADKGTRVVMNAAGATTITVNTSLFSAGDTLVIQNIGAGVTTVTAGTATVSSAGPLAIPKMVVAHFISLALACQSFIRLLALQRQVVLLLLLAELNRLPLPRQSPTFLPVVTQPTKLFYETCLAVSQTKT